MLLLQIFFVLEILSMQIFAYRPNLIDTIDDQFFPVSIIHVNDFHARFEESNSSGGPCNPGEKCIGGYARLVYVVRQLLEARKNTNPVYLNAGDSFQGTLWYNIGRWNVTSYFLNMLKADATTLGNHEFDHTIKGVVPFLESLTSPVVVANIDDSLEPTIQGKYKKSTVVVRDGRKIGIIGVILQTTNELASTGKLKFLNESEAVSKEAQRLKDEEDVDIFIVLSHCGLDVDRIIAKEGGPLIDVIVGGHSHSFLFTGSDLPGPDRPVDNYPVEIQQDSGHKVLIVQASAYAKYVGDLTVYFDKNGDLKNYEGKPIYLDNDVAQDKDIISELEPWKIVMDAQGKSTVAKSLVTLSEPACNFGECNVGNFITDAYVHAYASRNNTNDGEWTEAAIAITNVGGIRTSLERGIITYAHLITMCPFENTLDTLELRGDHLLEMLEFSVTKSWDLRSFNGANMLQVSGLKVIYNVSQPIGERVMDVEIRCQSCLIPRYEPINLTKMYRVIVPSFIAGGGDGFVMVRDNRVNHKVGPVDIDSLVEYAKLISPITTEVEGRITLWDN